MIIELVLVIPRSTGLDSNLGEPEGPRRRASGRQSGPVGSDSKETRPSKVPARREVKAIPGHLSEAKQSGGCSSVGRAPDLHSGGRRFDPDQLHQMGL